MATNDMVGGGGDIKENEVAIDYLKSSDFRVIWADGGVGNVTPNGLVHVAFYAERHAIPRRQVFKLSRFLERNLATSEMRCLKGGGRGHRSSAKWRVM